MYFGNIKIEGTDNISNRITNFLPFFISSLELVWSPVVQRLAVCPSVCKLFTFSSSHQEPLGQFQPNLRKIILGWRGFKFPQMKSHILFQGEIIKKIAKIQWQTTEPISTKFSTKHPWVKGTKVYANKGSFQFSKRYYDFLPQSMLLFNNSCAQMCLLIGTVCQMIDVACGPLFI